MDTRNAAGLLERMEQFEFDVVMPGLGRRETRRVVDEVQRFRSDVYREFGSMSVDDDHCLATEADEQSWHVVARVDTRLVGCLRVFVFDDATANDVCSRMLVFSGCRLSPGDEHLCEHALRQFALRAPTRSPLLQFGGLAVARIVRRSVLAVALCLAATAFTRALGSSGGVLFAAEKCRTESLYRAAGAFRLNGLNGSLPAFVDTFHHDRVVLMGTTPFGNRPELEAVVQHFEARLRPNLNLVA